MIKMTRASQKQNERTQHLTSILRVASAIGSSLDLDEVLAAVVKTVSELLTCQRTAIFILNQDNKLDLKAAEGVSEHYRKISQGIPVQRGGRSHALATNEMVYSDDVLRDPQALSVAPLAQEEGFRAFADLPLQYRGQNIGLLSVQFDDPHEFSEDELNLLRILAEQTAIAIGNARLHMKSDADLHRRLAALQRVTDEITSTVDLKHILNVVLNEAIQFSHADAGLTITWESDSTPTLQVSHGYDQLPTEWLNTADPHALISVFLEKQAPLCLPEIKKQTEILSYPPAAQAILLVPVFYEARLAAAILVQGNKPHAFSPEIIEFISELASLTAVAVGNAQRYQEQLRRGEMIHKRAEQMTLLLEVTRTLRSDRPLEDMLLDIAYAVQEGSGFDIVLISVLEGTDLRRVAGAGIPLVDLARLKKARHPWARVKKLFLDEFRMGHCYYIPAEYQNILQDMDLYMPRGHQPQALNGTRRAWDQADTFFIPLYGSTGEPVGLMSVDRPRDGLAPNAATAEIIEIFAAQVALAIENHKLVEDLRQQVNTLQLFNELNRAVTTKLDMSLVLNTVVQAVTNVLKYDSSTIFLKGKEGQSFIPMAASGYDIKLVEQFDFGPQDSLVNAVARTRMPLVVNDTSQEPRFKPGPIPVGALIMVPLVVEGNTVGVLSADSKEKRRLSPTEIATLTSLADQIAMAIENVRLFEEVTRFSEELETRVAERTQELAAALEDLRVQRDRSDALYHIASELVASLDIDRVLSQALLLLQRAVKATRSTVILIDPKTGDLVIRAAIGLTEPIPPGGRKTNLPKDSGTIAWILEHKETLVIPDLEKDKRWDHQLDKQARSALIVPILGNDNQILGVISLRSNMPRAFDEASVKLGEAAAVQLGNALNNAELYRLIREQAERLGVMLRTQQIEAAKHQAILEGIADGVMVADANGRIVLFNAAAEHILDLPRTQALGQFQDDILGLYGDSAREWLERIEHWKKNPHSYLPSEFMSQRFEIGNRIISFHLSPVIAQPHGFLGVVAVFRDITAQVEADRAKSEFVSTVSHELRTPMTSVKGYVDLLLMGSAGPLTELQEKFLKTVQTNANRLSSLVNDLLDISRIEMGRMELQRRPVAIESVINQVVDMMRPKMKEKGQELYAVLPDGLPKVYGDEDRLVQIITNLVGNSHKYTRHDGKIWIYAYVSQEVMHIAVKDTGIGIAPENRKKIFERFYREDSDLVHEEAGTGLGLSITLSLIQMHGGDLNVESELGVGSIFTFTLPLAEGEATNDVGHPPTGLSLKTKILVIEDEPGVSNLLEAVLEQEDVHVLKALTGAEAMRLVKEEKPALITLDIQLPDISGLDLLQYLRDNPDTAQIPIVVISVTQDHKKYQEAGVTYLAKPFDIEQLLSVIKPLLAQVAGDQGEEI